MVVAYGRAACVVGELEVVENEVNHGYRMKGRVLMMMFAMRSNKLAPASSATCAISNMYTHTRRTRCHRIASIDNIRLHICTYDSYNRIIIISSLVVFVSCHRTLGYVVSSDLVFDCYRFD